VTSDKPTKRGAEQGALMVGILSPSTPDTRPSLLGVYLWIL
jgi:hypothetical protein